MADLGSSLRNHLYGGGYGDGMYNSSFGGRGSYFGTNGYYGAGPHQLVATVDNALDRLVDRAASKVPGGRRLVAAVRGACRMDPYSNQYGYGSHDWYASQHNNQMPPPHAYSRTWLGSVIHVLWRVWDAVRRRIADMLSWNTSAGHIGPYGYNSVDIDEHNGRSLAWRVLGSILAPGYQYMSGMGPGAVANNSGYMGANLGGGFGLEADLIGLVWRVLCTLIPPLRVLTGALGWLFQLPQFAMAIVTSLTHGVMQRLGGYSAMLHSMAPGTDMMAPMGSGYGMPYGGTYGSSNNMTPYMANRAPIFQYGGRTGYGARQPGMAGGYKPYQRW